MARFTQLLSVAFEMSTWLDFNRTQCIGTLLATANVSWLELPQLQPDRPTSFGSPSSYPTFSSSIRSWMAIDASAVCSYPAYVRNGVAYSIFRGVHCRTFTLQSDWHPEATHCLLLDYSHRPVDHDAKQPTHPALLEDGQSLRASTVAGMKHVMFVAAPAPAPP